MCATFQGSVSKTAISHQTRYAHIKTLVWKFAIFVCQKEFESVALEFLTTAIPTINHPCSNRLGREREAFSSWQICKISYAYIGQMTDTRREFDLLLPRFSFSLTVAETYLQRHDSYWDGQTEAWIISFIIAPFYLVPFSFVTREITNFKRGERRNWTLLLIIKRGKKKGFKRE